MSTRSFSDDLRSRTDDLWSAILRHPFVQGIGTGSLAIDVYADYLKQDYLYLSEFSRVFALASAKAKNLVDMAFFSRLLDATLNVEMALHRRTCTALGIGEVDLKQAEPAMVTVAYTSLLLRTCYEGGLPDILSVLLPCAAGYVEVAQHLKNKGLPPVSSYRDWIETYSSKDFVEFAKWLKKRLDSLATNASVNDRDHWRRLYVRSTRFELLFFDMAWSQKMWPAIVPAETGFTFR